MTHIRLSDHEEKIGKEIVDSAFKIHKRLGPGLLEKVYELCMEYELQKRGFKVERQVPVPIEYDDHVFSEAFKLDLLIDGRVIVELKAVDRTNQLWEAQTISHMKLTGVSLGFLINFNVPLIKQGIKRFLNE